MKPRTDTPAAEPVESVRCLQCAAVYSKPCGGGTFAANPGCPACGYLGWLPVGIPFERRGADRERQAVTPLHS